MKIGIPREIKADEYRVAMTPAGVRRLAASGHEVMVESQAGTTSGFSDEDFEQAGAVVAGTHAEVLENNELIVKVKEPQREEIELFHPGQIVFTYFHFAADPDMANGCLRREIVAVAYETITDCRGRLPLLTPMSEIAGKMSVQEGAKYLETPQNGRGILLGGVPGVAPAKVVILGGGIVGTNAATVAAGLGADVVILDVNLDRLRYLDEIMPANVKTIFSDPYTVREYLREADLVIGAVLIPGAKAPRLIQSDDLCTMKRGSVIVDVAVDQGGCVETTRPTTHQSPTFVVDGVVHYCVANMPGAVGRTSTIALCNATFPYALQIANLGFENVMAADAGIAVGLNMADGRVTNRAVADALNVPFVPFTES